MILKIENLERCDARHNAAMRPNPKQKDKDLDSSTLEVVKTDFFQFQLNFNYRILFGNNINLPLLRM